MKRSTNRRKILFGLTGGITSFHQLPQTWSKPIIESILIPAHAQTSVTTECPNGALTLNGFTTDCSVSSNNPIFFQIDDSDMCSPIFTAPAPGALDAFTVSLATSASQTAVDVFVVIGGTVNQGTIDLVNGECPGVSSSGMTNVSGTITGLSGSTFSASGTINATPTQIIVSDINFAPV